MVSNNAVPNLCAGMLVTAVLGSIHAFSVFITPFESLLEASRADVSLIYSGALVCLTVVVLTGHRIYSRASPPVLVLLSLGLASAGSLVASFATSWWLLFLGYSVLFGGANGLGYGYVLQLVARLIPERKGFAMGAVTAAYALGATLFAMVFASLIENYSAAVALRSMTVVLFLSGLVAATVFYLTNALYDSDVSSNAESPAKARTINASIVLIWAAYGCAVSSGLMVLGHATGIVIASGASESLAVSTLMLIALGNALGGFVAGWLSDRVSTNYLLTALPLLATACLIVVALFDAPRLAVGGLAFIGFSYGSLIAIYPVYIASLFGQSGPAVYGRVFTAWGFAGLAAPWFAGRIFDASGTYTVALVVAAAVAVASTLLATRLPRTA